VKYLHNLSRIEAFSDAIFAFVATFMVVNFNKRSDFIVRDKTGAIGFFGFLVSIFVLVTLISIVLASLEVGIRYGFPGFAYVLLGLFFAAQSYLFYKKIHSN